MAIITKPHTFTAGQAAVASEVNSNFDTLYSAVNGGLDTTNISTNKHLITWTLQATLSSPAATDYFCIRTPSGVGAITLLEMSIIAGAHTGGAMAGQAALNLKEITNPSGPVLSAAINTSAATATAVLTPASVTSFTGTVAANKNLLFEVATNAAWTGSNVTLCLIGKSLIQS
tara:strand:- start:3213 stop:3731 length:519 start_codon:yes stop_codon:yes gene_type:complete